MPRDDKPMNLAVQPVLLSGGNGSRLWPVSRTSLPKQFLALSGDGSMIQETALRVADRSRFRDPIVICGEQQRFLVADHLRMTGARPQIVLEPEGRNTAYPIAVAALLTAEAGSHDTILAVLPADHRIGDPDAFLQSISKAAAAAAAEPVIVTLGAKPTAPETGFGYILPGAPIDGVDDAFVVERFVEKPDRPTAERYLAEGRHLWNSGMFVASAATVLAAFEEHAPEVLDAARTAVAQATRDLDFLRLPLEATRLCPVISFDYAVMERVARCAVVPSEFDWSDLGSWQAIWESGDRDANGNVVDGDVIALDSRDSYLLSDANGPLLATLGVENLVVVATRDAVLVADKARAQDVKKIVEDLKARKRSEATQHPRMYRPWGYYETLCLGDRFQVKRIVVTPGGKLSLQSHQHRAEHWVVVAGTATVVVDGEEKMLLENESVYVPLGAVHRLENRGKIDLTLIEVQSGAYLGEDDIVRYEDVYARV